MLVLVEASMCFLQAILLLASLQAALQLSPNLLRSSCGRVVQVFLGSLSV